VEKITTMTGFYEDPDGNDFPLFIRAKRNRCVLCAERTNKWDNMCDELDCVPIGPLTRETRLLISGGMEWL